MKAQRLGLAFSAALATFCAAAPPAPSSFPITDGEKPKIGPLVVLPYTPSLEPAFLDRKVDPCVDFYQYACGGWMAQNPIPPDQARWSVNRKRVSENQRFLWGILEEAARKGTSGTPIQQKLGDYFAACMDEAGIERLGLAPLRAQLDALAKLRKKAELPRWLGAFHSRYLDVENAMAFGFGSDQDPGNTTQVIAWAVSGGLGLPGRDSYVRTDERSIETRRRYAEHVETMLALAGDSKAAASQGAAAVMRIESALAQATLTPVEKRDPHKVYHRVPLARLQALTSSFCWQDYLAARGAPLIAAINLTEPRFFEELETQLRTESVEAWKAYLRWHAIMAAAPYLSSPFVDADFRFFRAYLRGVKEVQPRWKRCVAWADRDLGEALGQLFVERTFPPAVKAKTFDMVQRIEKAMALRIQRLDWMSATTKQHALAKLRALRNKIGYPDNWRDYAALAIRRDDFLGNVERASAFESKRQLEKIGRPVNRDEWEMTPPSVNAYYHPLRHDMNFTAGVLLPPRFDPRLDDAPNYGDIGAAIGHELIHAFDDEGRQFDAAGNLKDWWTAEDAKEFEKRASCIASQYGEYVIVDDIKINSRLTLGEDVADLGGLILAYLGWRDATAEQKLPPLDGLTPEQRFFIGYAQWSCTNQRDEDKRVTAHIDPHSPPSFRINGVVANMPEFAKAFSCRRGAPLSREKVCQVW